MGRCDCDAAMVLMYDKGNRLKLLSNYVLQWVMSTPEGAVHLSAPIDLLLEPSGTICHLTTEFRLLTTWVTGPSGLEAFASCTVTVLICCAFINSNYVQNSN